jgi:hypothetical protein
MAADRDRIPLILVPRALRERNIDRNPPTYRQLYHAVINGVVPAQQGPNGRWSVRVADLRLIAETLSALAIAA